MNIRSCAAPSYTPLSFPRPVGNISLLLFFFWELCVYYSLIFFHIMTDSRRAESGTERENGIYITLFLLLLLLLLLSYMSGGETVVPVFLFLMNS